MTEKEMISQINDLISDRKSFITSDEEESEIFKKDVEALEMILSEYAKIKVDLQDTKEHLGEYIHESEKEIKQLKELCNKYEEEHNTVFEEWKKVIGDNSQ